MDLDTPGDRPLLEILILFSLLYLTAFLPGDAAATGRALSLPSWHIAALVQTLPRALFLAWFIGKAGDPASFGVAWPPSGGIPSSLGSAAIAASGALGIALLPRLASSLLGLPAPENPLVAAIGGPRAPAMLLIPLVLLSSLAVGYSEELFFRSYLMRRLRDLGLAPPATALVSALLFGASHGLQGLYGLVVASLLGGWFALLRLRGASIHALGPGHGFYNAAVILGSLYGGA